MLVQSAIIIVILCSWAVVYAIILCTLEFIQRIVDFTIIFHNLIIAFISIIAEWPSEDNCNWCGDV